MRTVFNVFFEALALQKPGFPTQTSAQSDEEYIRAFAFAISQIPDEIWNSLPRYAHDWHIKVAGAINTQQPFNTWPSCEGFISIHTPLREPGVISEPIPQVFPIAPQKPKRVAPKNSKYAGAIKETRKIIMLHPEWSARTVHKFLDGSGYSGIKFDVVSVVASETRAMVQLAKELGFWRETSIYDKSNQSNETAQQEAAEQKSSS